ncbi:Protein GVQW1 [Plecturocebus cupreus]
MRLKKGFHHVGQTCLELLTSSDLPASASQSVGITGKCLPVPHSALRAVYDQSGFRQTPKTRVPLGITR